jgi:hypothetical protein
MSQKEKEKPIVDDTKEGLKIKKKPSLRNKTPQTTKLDLTKKQEDAVQESKPEETVLRSDEEKQEQVVGLQEVGSTHEKEETTKEAKVEDKKEEEVKSPIVEVINEEVKETTKELKEAIRDEKVTGKKLPENIEKLVSFMEETGGTVEDYVNLNRDYSKYEPKSLLQEYYKKTKPHLDQEEINFLMEDNFSYDEDVDEERDIRKKKLAYKEEIAKAKKFLESSKSKYYDEIKLRPGVTQEQQKALDFALDFFNRYNKEQQIAEQRRKTFRENTNSILNDEFKGFEFDLGEKKFKYNISNPSAVAEKQSDLNTFVKKFLNKEGEVIDTVGYHKAIYAADNADTIASHFYEQGKADAIKDMMAKSKNINNDPRPQATGDVFINGLRVKAVNGVDTSKLKIKSKK